VVAAKEAEVVVCPPTQVSIPLAAKKIMIVSSFNCT
jgi:hypothetical protein